MTVEIITDVEQNTPAWLELRRGIVTASEIDCVIANGKGKGVPSVTRRKYLLRLAAERFGAELAEAFSNGHTERGHLYEEQARELYSFATGNEIERVTFIRNGEPAAKWAWGGCSPDALLAARRRGLEIKSKLPHLQMEVLIANEVPPEHIPQVQGQMMFGELEAVDFMSFWPGLPPFIRTVLPDKSYIDWLRSEVDRFNDELAAVVETIRRYGEPMPVEPDASGSLLMAG